MAAAKRVMSSSPNGTAAHRTHNVITVVKIRQRLNVGSSKQIFLWRRSMENPFPFKALNVVLRKLPIACQSLSFCDCHALG